MVGLIWMVQVVHYPLFAKVGEAKYTDYQKSHQLRTTLVVGPPMLIEAFSTVLLAIYVPTGISLVSIWIGIALVFAIWISTAALQVPCHSKLEQAFEASVHRRLVVSNWVRTVAWSARGALVTGWMWQLLNVS